MGSGNEASRAVCTKPNILVPAWTSSCSTISKILMRLRPTAGSCNTSNKLHRVAQQGSCSILSPHPQASAVPEKTFKRLPIRRDPQWNFHFPCRQLLFGREAIHLNLGRVMGNVLTPEALKTNDQRWRDQTFLSVRPKGRSTLGVSPTPAKKWKEKEKKGKKK